MGLQLSHPLSYTKAKNKQARVNDHTPQGPKPDQTSGADIGEILCDYLQYQMAKNLPRRLLLIIPSSRHFRP